MKERRRSGAAVLTHTHALLQLLPVLLQHSSSASLHLLLPLHTTSLLPPSADVAETFHLSRHFFLFFPRGYCLPLSAIQSAACDQTGASQCASKGPAEGEAPFSHVMPHFRQLVECQSEILAVYKLAARVSTSTSSNTLDDELIWTLF